MSTHMPEFQSFLGILHHLVLVKLAIRSMRVNPTCAVYSERPGPTLF